MNKDNLFYTSINNNYLPKARVLAKSVKEQVKDATFYLVLADDFPEGWDLSKEPFDKVYQIKDLDVDVPNIHMWTFIHSVVELCTAVKGPALLKFLNEGFENVIYLDPDIAVFDPMEELFDILDHNDIILTPHQTHYEKEEEAVVDNEICSLIYGVYNYGFYAVHNSENGKDYAKWWSDRLISHCYDDIPHGLFTDQRWGDIVPCLFDNVKIWKHPGANVSTWNLTHRNVTKEKDTFYVNGKPLLFYHFSGFDSGNQLVMLDKYSKGNNVLYELRSWYISQLEQNGQIKYATYKSVYNFFSNGEMISNGQRLTLRKRGDLQNSFRDSNPFMVERGGYYYWAKKHANEILPTGDYAQQLNEILNSRSYRLVCKLKKIKNKVLLK